MDRWAHPPLVLANEDTVERGLGSDRVEVSHLPECMRQNHRFATKVFSRDPASVVPAACPSDRVFTPTNRLDPHSFMQ